MYIYNTLSTTSEYKSSLSSAINSDVLDITKHMQFLEVTSSRQRGSYNHTLDTDWCTINPLPATHSLTHNPTLTLIEGTQPGSSSVSHHPWQHPLPATHSLTHNPTLTLIEGTSSQGAVVCHTIHREPSVLCLHSYTAITSLQG